MKIQLSQQSEEAAAGEVVEEVAVKIVAEAATVVAVAAEVMVEEAKPTGSPKVPSTPRP